MIKSNGHNRLQHAKPFVLWNSKILYTRSLAVAERPFPHHKKSLWTACKYIQTTKDVDIGKGEIKCEKIRKTFLLFFSQTI